MLVFRRRHLQSVLAEYGGHYNGHRAHRSLCHAPPLRPAQLPAVVGARIMRRDRLGVLIGESQAV
jgi:hypothetical protein